MEYEDGDDIIDPFEVDSVVSKQYERRIQNSPEFEAVCSKYWQLLHSQPGCNRSSVTISKDQYTEMMKRVYKVLLPLYREEEVSREVSQEWIFDSRCQEEMNIALFTKTLLRVAHSWATHIDVHEYVELLNMVYGRITCKKVIRGQTGQEEIVLPRIQIEMFQEEVDVDDWESCMSEEQPDFEYRDDEDEKGNRKRYKRLRKNQDEYEASINAREPLMFKEIVEFYARIGLENTHHDAEPPNEEDTVVDLLLQLHDVYPLGYPTEQFINKLKNEIVENLKKQHEDRKKALALMKRQLQTTDGAKVKIQKPPEIKKDAGMILNPQGAPFEQFFQMHDSKNTVRIRTYLRIEDKVYNSLRKFFIEQNEQLVQNVCIRPFFKHPTNYARKNILSQKNLTSADPVTMLNEVNYNPALERRLSYIVISCQFEDGVKSHCVNVNYLLDDPIYQTAFRADVERIETSQKMSVERKVEAEGNQMHEFVNVTTPFKDVMKIMLTMKFQTFFTAKMSGKQEKIEKQRDLKIYEAEQNRKNQAMLPDNLVAKNLSETFDEKNYLKLMKGPFYNYISKEGIKEDYMETCDTLDLIDSANTGVMKVLLIGKPRTGKTTLAKALANKLDLVRVAPEVWLDDLFARIKDREENPPEEDEEDEEEPQPDQDDKNDDDADPDAAVDDAEAKKLEEEKAKQAQLDEKKEPERAKKDRWLTDLEYNVRNLLRSGGCLENHMIDQIIRLQVNSPVAQTKGFILDLDIFQCEGAEAWAIRLEDTGIISDDNEITHIIELLAEDDEVKLRSSSIRVQTETGIPFSLWERKERNKPKVKSEDEEEQEEEDEEDLSKKPLDENKMVMRPCDAPEKIHRELEHYNLRERVNFDIFIHKMFDSTYIKMDIAGINPEELSEAIVAKIKPISSTPLRPVAHVIEDGGSFKDLLTAGIDEENFNVPRQWSLWKTIDPVALSKGQVEQGLPEFAAHYANNVFVFVNEDNLKDFVKSPWQYLNAPPHMPEKFRILMFGPRGVGVHTQANKLHSQYGWRVVDFLQIVKNKLNEIFSLPQKLPNNITDLGPCMIGLSDQEFQDIKEGKPIPSWKFIPWILEYLNVPQTVKEKPPPEPDSETDAEWDEAKLKAHKEKKKQKEKEAKAALKAAQEKEAAKQERAQKRQEAIEAGQDLEELGLADSEEELPPIEDFPIDFIIPQKKEDGSMPNIDKFILIGFPQTEIHCQKLKEYGIEFDRILFLSDKSEEDAGKKITERMKSKSNVGYEYDAELEIANSILALVKENCIPEEKEDILKDIDCSGTIEEVFIKIQSELDPFFVLPDNTDDIKVSEEYDEEEKHRIPKSDFGDFCPVTYKEQQFLIKGSEERELFVLGKRYLFAGEEEMEKFKFNPQKYMLVQFQNHRLPLAPPPPKVMITGTKCSGVTSQISKICQKYKLDNLDLFQSYKTLDEQELRARQRLRLLDRGYKGVPEPEDPEAEPEVDEEIVNDPDDFEKPAQELKQLQTILNPAKGLIVDGNWNDNVEDGGLETSEPIFTLLENARRLPEIAVILRCKEEVSVTRNYNVIQHELKQKFDRLTKEREERIVRERQEAREEKIKELKATLDEDEEMKQDEKDAKLREEMETWDEERKTQEEEEDENDPDKPDLEKMKEEIEEKIKEIHARQSDFLDQLKEAFEAKQIKVIELETSKVSIDYIGVKLDDKLKEHFKFRKDLIERNQVIQLKPKEVPVYEASYTFKQSKFGEVSPITPYNPKKTKDFAALYRQRIYFFSDENERQKFMLEPSSFIQKESFPQDIKIRPKCVVIGLPFSGKSDLCAKIAEVSGAVHLQIEDIVEDFIERDSCFAQKLRDRLKYRGGELDDLLTVQLIQKRVERADCVRCGWVLDGFPQTRSQAILLAKKGLLPHNVFSINIPVDEIYNRTAAFAEEKFDCNRIVLKKRLEYALTNQHQTTFFFTKFYNNNTSIDGLKSKWFGSDIALRAIKNTLEARMNFARDYSFDQAEKTRACVMQNMNIDRVYFKQSISKYVHFCPVSWKLDKKFINCTHIPEYSVLYKNQFYFFANEQKRDIFVRNPANFADKTLFSQARNIPIRFKVHKAAEISETEKSLMNYCPVTLLDEEKLVPGCPLHIISYKEERFCIASEEKLLKFFENPSRYSKAALPVKIPAEVRPVSLYRLAQEKDAVSYLEQALGSVVTKGLREIGETRLKYPTLSVKETMLKLFALFLKTENPANTEHMKKKYRQKMEDFLEKCTVPEELNDLAHKKSKGKWPQFKENYYNQLGNQYDQILKDVEKEKAEGFISYMK